MTGQKDTTSKNKSAVAIFQYQDVSDIVLCIDSPQKGSGVLVLNSKNITYLQSKYNESCFGDILDSLEGC